MRTRNDKLDTSGKDLFPKSTLIPIILLFGALITSAAIALFGLLWLSRISATTLLAGLLGITEKTAWHLSRSAGTVAFLLLAGSTAWGLIQSSKIVKEIVPAGLSYGMHNILSWLALIFTGFHALVLLLDNFYTYTLPDLIVPFIGPYKPFWVGLGIISLYLMVIVIVSSRYLKQIGQKRWRALHYLSFALYVLATVHGLAAGTDSSKLSMQLMYLGSGLLILFLTIYRFLTRQSASTRSSVKVVS